MVAPVPPALFAQVLAPLQKYRKCRRHVGPTVVFVVTLAQAFGLEIYTLLSTSSLSDQHRVTDLPPRTHGIPQLRPPSPSISPSPTHLSLIHAHSPSLPCRSLTIHPPLRRNGRRRLRRKWLVDPSFINHAPLRRVHMRRSPRPRLPFVPGKGEALLFLSFTNLCYASARLITPYPVPHLVWFS